MTGSSAVYIHVSVRHQPLASRDPSLLLVTLLLSCLHSEKDSLPSCPRPSHQPDAEMPLISRTGVGVPMGVIGASGEGVLVERGKAHSGLSRMWAEVLQGPVLWG